LLGVGWGLDKKAGGGGTYHGGRWGLVILKKAGGGRGTYHHCHVTSLSSIFKFLILCLWIKLLLFNYNIQNNLTIIIIYRKMKWR
jgi:hypothetical protein